MGARESVVDCQPRKVEPMIMLNLTKWGGGGGVGGNRTTNYGYVEMVSCVRAAIMLSHLHRFSV